MKPSRLKWRLFAASLACCLAGCGTAPAPGSAACAPQPLARLPVEFHAGVPAVASRIDGHPAWMVLDLGSTTSVLAEATADRLALPRDPTALPTIIGMGGSETRWAVTARHVDLGGLSLDHKRLEVASIGLGDTHEPVDGAFGLDVLGRYDIGWDLPDGTVTLAARSGCAAPPPGWAGAIRVPLGHPLGEDYAPGPRLLLLPVAVDGRRLTALLDSGAAASLISPDAAARIEPAGGGSGPHIGLTGIGPQVQSGTFQRFRSLTVAGDTTADPVLVVGPVPLWAGQMILGVGFLRQHRVWLPAGGAALWVDPTAR